MEVNLKGRHARLLIETTINAIRDAQENNPNTRYGFEFALFSTPAELTDSETLSSLDKLLGAVKRFDENAPLRLVLNVPVQSALQSELLQTIQTAFERVMALEMPTAPPRIEE